MSRLSDGFNTRQCSPVRCVTVFDSQNRPSGEHSRVLRRWHRPGSCAMNVDSAHWRRGKGRTAPKLWLIAGRDVVGTGSEYAAEHYSRSDMAPRVLSTR